MTLPRQVVPGRDYMITRRCSERRFFLRPDEDTDNTFIYCLALAARRAKVQITFSVAMSNHHHTGIHDPEGNFPIFTEHFHGLLARCQNEHRAMMHDGGPAWPGQSPIVATVGELSVRMTSWRSTGRRQLCLHWKPGLGRHTMARVVGLRDVLDSFSKLIGLVQIR